MCDFVEEVETGACKSICYGATRRRGHEEKQRSFLDADRPDRSRREGRGEGTMRSQLGAVWVRRLSGEGVRGVSVLSFALCLPAVVEPVPP